VFAVEDERKVGWIGDVRMGLCASIACLLAYIIEMRSINIKTLKQSKPLLNKI